MVPSLLLLFVSLAFFEQGNFEIDVKHELSKIGYG